MKLQTLEAVWNILIVEDNPIIRKIHTLLLQALDHQVHVAENGRCALQLHLSNLYDAILLDIGLPDIDGVEVARTMRLRERDRKKTPIIAITTHSGIDFKARCLEIGINRMVQKPINKDDLNTILQSLIVVNQ